MFAVVVIAGKQYRVAVGDKLDVDKIEGKKGASVSFDHVLLIAGDKSPKIGTPTVKGASVKAKILSQDKGEKIEVRRFKSKVRYRKHRGMRPFQTKLEITAIA